MFFYQKTTFSILICKVSGGVGGGISIGACFTCTIFWFIYIEKITEKSIYKEKVQNACKTLCSALQ